jgi:hypothetical protein
MPSSAEIVRFWFETSRMILMIDDQTIYSIIDSSMHDTAKSLCKSFDAYWAGDAAGKNDSPERTLSLHFGHALLSRDFAVYAEADHPHGYSTDTSGVNRTSKWIDILGIDPSRTWFLSAEFKRQLCHHFMSESIGDLTRVERFHLNPNHTEAQRGPDRMAVIRSCTTGIGLVAGLVWVKQGALPPRVETILQSEFGEQISRRSGRVGEPIHVRTNKVKILRHCGSYYLQYACVPTISSNVHAAVG